MYLCLPKIQICALRLCRPPKTGSDTTPPAPWTDWDSGFQTQVVALAKSRTHRNNFLSQPGAQSTPTTHFRSNLPNIRGGSSFEKRQVEYIRAVAPHLWERPLLDEINVRNGILNVGARQLRGRGYRCCEARLRRSVSETKISAINWPCFVNRREKFGP